MKHSLLTLVLALPMLAALLSGCRHAGDYPAELYIADSLVMCNSDSAVAYLNALAPRMKSAPEDVCRYYQLLTIKAADKASMPHASDSLMHAVLRYYKQEGNVQLLPEAYYYAGRITIELGDVPQALDYFNQAAEALASEEYQAYSTAHPAAANQLRGYIHAQKAVLLNSQHLYDSAVADYEMALRCDSVGHDTLRMIQDYRSLGQVHLNRDDYAAAMRHIHRSQRLAVMAGDTLEFFNSRCEEAYILLETGLYAEALDLMEHTPMRITPDNEQDVNYLMAVASWKAGDDERAAGYFGQLLTCDNADIRINANHWMAGYKIQGRQLEEAYAYINEENRLKDSLSSVQSHGELAVANSLYNYQLREKENMQLKQQEQQMRTQLLMAILVALLLVLVVAVIIAHGHRRRADLRDRNELLRFLLAAKAKEHDEPAGPERVAQSLAALRNSEAVQLVTAKAKAGKALNDADWEAVEQSLLAIIPDFLSRLRGVHSYSQVEWRMSVLTRMEVTVPDMSILLSRSKVTLYGMRKRLFQKVFPEGAKFTDWQDFVMSL